MTVLILTVLVMTATPLKLNPTSEGLVRHLESANSNPPEFAQPSLIGPKGGHPQREGTNLGVFVPWLVIRMCLFLYGWSLSWCEGTNMGVIDLRLSTYSNESGSPGLRGGPGSWFFQTVGGLGSPLKPRPVVSADKLNPIPLVQHLEEEQR